MHEIKFRVWNKTRQVMSYDVTLYANGWVECVFVDGSENKYPPHIAKEFLRIMQYTGLKDINGNEIYEGDIVECFNDGNSYVSFRGGVYGLIHDYNFIPFSDVHGKMKVIGNVYENPELLEGEGEMNEICPTCNGSGGIDMFEDSIGEIVIVPRSDCRGSGESND